MQATGIIWTHDEVTRADLRLHNLEGCALRPPVFSSAVQVAAIPVHETEAALWVIDDHLAALELGLFVARTCQCQQGLVTGDEMLGGRWVGQ